MREFINRYFSELLVFGIIPVFIALCILLLIGFWEWWIYVIVFVVYIIYGIVLVG
jgi:hypothetical protein